MRTTRTPSFFLALALLSLVSVRAAITDRHNSKYFNWDVVEEETFLTPSDFAAMSEPTDDATAELEGEWNREASYNPNLFEGDIANDLNATTVALFLNGGPTSGQKDDVQLNAIRDRRQLWKQGRIPYALSNQYTPQSRAIIASAMHEYAKHTCIQWTPRTQYDTDYIFILPERGCYSMVGRVGGRQVLSLGQGCIQRGIIMHEMGNRDSYVTILWQNIQRGMEGQFEKYTPATIQTFGTQYDYNSVLHYDSRAFSKNGQPTIVPKTNAQIGQRAGFSQMDAFKINRLYECTPPPSTGGGQTTPNPLVTYTQPAAITTTTQQPSIRNITRGLPLVPLHKCINKRPDCDQLARDGWCVRNSGWMREHCPRSCNVCEKNGSETCEDLRVDCLELVKRRYCITAKKFAKEVCSRSCGFCFAPPVIEETIHAITPAPQVVIQTLTPYTYAPATTTTTLVPPITCMDKNFRCVQWKKAGYCNGRYSSYMRDTCARSCGWCRNLTPKAI